MDEESSNLPVAARPGAIAPAQPGSRDVTLSRQGPQDVYFPDDGTRMGVNPVVAVYSRKDWGALPTTETMPLRRPVDNIRFTDTGKGSPKCKQPEECFQILRKLQKEHIEELKLSDIRYNFLIGNDGTVYEGRGWDADADRSEEFNHLRGNCVDVAYIGDATDNNVHPDMIISGYNWVIHGMNKRYLVEKPNIIQMEEIDEPPELKKLANKFFNKK